MTDKNADIAGLPPFDPNADRGNVVDDTPAPAVVELTADELKLIGKDSTPEKDTKAADAAKQAAERGDTLPEPDKEPDKKATETPTDKAATPEKDAKAEPDKEPAKEEQPRDEKTGKFIPKARFDAVNNRAKARIAELEAEVTRLRTAGQPDEGAPDVAALETALDAKGAEYSQLLADGELEKANVVLREINKINRQIGVLEATALSNAHQQEVTHVTTLEELVGIYKENYPQFDDAQPDHYNQDMVNYVARLQGGFEMAGYSPAEALREAVEAAVAKFGLDPEPAAAEPAAPAAPAAPTKGDQRQQAGVEKALATARAQPAAMDKVGADSDKAGMAKVDVNNLSYEQFNALPESTLARLRGDNV